VKLKTNQYFQICAGLTFILIGLGLFFSSLFNISSNFHLFNEKKVEFEKNETIQIELRNHCFQKQDFLLKELILDYLNKNPFNHVSFSEFKQVPNSKLPLKTFNLILVGEMEKLLLAISDIENYGEKIFILSHEIKPYETKSINNEEHLFQVYIDIVYYSCLH